MDFNYQRALLLFFRRRLLRHDVTRRVRQPAAAYVAITTNCWFRFDFSSDLALKPSKCRSRYRPRLFRTAWTACRS